MTRDLPILPGRTLGILGGGQLGRMLAMEAQRMGYRVHVYDPSPKGPAAQVANEETNASFEDEANLRAFFNAVDVVTFEFENIPTGALENLRSSTPLYPKIDALKICQNRILEKDFIASLGLLHADFSEVRSPEDVRDFLENHPNAILKTATLGYDGKGQCKMQAGDDIEARWKLFQGRPTVIERQVELEAELSVVIARNLEGEMACFPVAHNTHRNHILDTTVAPAPISETLARQARMIAEEIAAGIHLVGVLCVELFVENGSLLVNELAPRPHNSGHYTLDACVTNQFEQQLRAVMGLALGDPSMHTPHACMVNILGEAWESGTPPWDRLLTEPDLKLHLYGKESARPGRKMGHFVVTAQSHAKLLELAHRARKVFAKESID